MGKEPTTYTDFLETAIATVAANRNMPIAEVADAYSNKDNLLHTVIQPEVDTEIGRLLANDAEETARNSSLKQ